MRLLLPFGLLLASGFADELAPQKYIDLVMDYLNTLPPEVEGPYGPLVFDSTTLQCAEDALDELPKLPIENSRENLYQHMMTGLFLKGDENALDAIKAAMTADAWIYNGVFVMETMLNFDMIFDDTLDGISTNPDSWDFSAVNWTITGSSDAELSEDYMADILGGHPNSADVIVLTEVIAPVLEAYEDVFMYSSARTICQSPSIIQIEHWVCPLGFDPATAICPGGCVEEGCVLETSLEQVCGSYGQESFNWGVSPLAGSWGMDWFEDQVGNYGPPALSGFQQWEILEGAAQAIASMNSFSGAPFAGDQFASAVQAWFDANNGNYSTIVSEILNSGAYEGLDWLLTAGEFMFSDFGGNNRNGSGGANYATSSNGYWQIYDMIDLVSVNGSWNVFGNQWNEGNASYVNFTMGHWNSWLESHEDEWGGNSQQLIEFWSTMEWFNAIRNGTMNIYGPGGEGGGGGTPGEIPIIIMSSVEWPFPTGCITKTYRASIEEYLTTHGKDPQLITDMNSFWLRMSFDQGLDWTLAPGSVSEVLTGTAYGTISLQNFLNELDPTGAKWAAFEPCWALSEFNSLIARVESQLLIGTFWDPPAAADSVEAGVLFEDANWNELRLDEDCCSVDALSIAEDYDAMPNLDWIWATNSSLQIADQIVPLLDSACCDFNSSLLGFNVTNQTDGYGSLHGDPHVIVQTQGQSSGQEAICFKLDASENGHYSLLADGALGLEASGELVHEGEKFVMEKVYITSPKGLQIEINSYFLKIARDGKIILETLMGSFDEFGIDDVHFALCGVASGDHNNAVKMTISGMNGEKIELLVATKQTKSSLRFSVLNSDGLSTTGLTGIIGESIMPHDYKIDQNGFVHIGNRVILGGEQSHDSNNDCLLLSDDDVALFIGHPVADFQTIKTFELLEDVSPK